MTETRILSLGLDGAAWRPLNRLMDNGHLPNLSSLVETGARAPLRSVHPPVTCPAWRCSTSGKNPGRLGVYWWLMLDRPTGTLTTPDSRSFDTADIWDYLSDEGWSCAVVNVPMTYPPPRLNGIAVSGFGAPFETDITGSITYPPAFQDRLFEEYEWDIGVRGFGRSTDPDQVMDLIRTRFELLFDLLEEGYEYVHLTVFYVNMLQHKFGHGPETRRAWELIDEYLGRLDDDLFKIIYSDHGHSTVEYTFSVNRFLLDEEHLTVRGRPRDAVMERAYRLLESVGVSPRTFASASENFLPDRIYEWLVSGSLTGMGELAQRVDWGRSRALALSQGPVYINRKLVDDYEAYRATLKVDLETLQYDGLPVLEAVHYGEDVYAGEYIDAAPDLVLVPKRGVEIYGGMTPSTFETEVTSWTSGNHPIGMVLLHGEDVASMRLDEQSLLDIAPTLLRYANCRVPTDTDGTAIERPFVSGLDDRGTRSPLEPTYSCQSAADDELEEHLGDLGYLE